MNFVKTSYNSDDVVILLQDIKGKVPILDTAEREKLNQQGVHYSEMLPLEYRPTEKYMSIYQDSLENLSNLTANGIELLSRKLVSKYKYKPFIIVSLARAGTPSGILLKRYLKKKYNIDCPHYSVSIIRGKGIDERAMLYIAEHNPEDLPIQFLDGWIGKGAICRQLQEAVMKLKSTNAKLFGDLDAELATLSDPACETSLYGTRQDFLIPSACLNATVSGLISRTVKLKTMTDKDFHGAIYYGEYEDVDKSKEFIDTVEKYFSMEDRDLFNPSIAESDENFKGIDEVKRIASEFRIADVNKVKPGVGETTRVLLRRLPDRVLIRRGLLGDEGERRNLAHILQLCEEKHAPVEEYDLQKYNVCGIIKNIASSDL